MDTIIILHEVYGVTDNLYKLELALKAKGYNVIVPSLYPDAYVGTNEKYSYNKFFAEVGIDKGIHTLDHIIETNKRDRIILIGFSVGATLAWLKATDKRVSGIICFYGSRIRNYKEIMPVVPVKLFFCNEKDFDITELIAGLAPKKNVRIEIIPGEHGFYSKESFESPLIQETNMKIIDELKNEAFSKVS